MAGTRYDPRIRERAIRISDDMRGHVTGAEVARMLKAEGHVVPERTVCLWLKRRTPLTPVVERLERQSVNTDSLALVEQLEATAIGLARLGNAMAKRLESQVERLMISLPDDAGRIADAMLTLTRCSIETTRAVDALRVPRISNFADPEKSLPIDRSASEVSDQPFAWLNKGRSNFDIEN